MKYHLLFLLIGIKSAFLWSQQEGNLLEEIDGNSSSTYTAPAFKAFKVGNLQSTKLAGKKELYLYLSHRFGSLDEGFDTFFGLDNANTKIQLLYGITDKLQIGASRESLRKTYALSAKYGIIRQSNSFPFNIVSYTTINGNSEVSASQFPGLEFEDRLSYATQLLISRRINERLSLLIAPSFVRQNAVLEISQDNNQFALGIGGRLKLSKRFSLNIDYVPHLNRAQNSTFVNPLTIGVDIETGGHVFQLLFTNAQSTNEPGFISNAEGDWSKSDIFFGFNVVRVF